MSLEVFGKIVTAAHVEAAAIATLQDWLPTYLAEIERQTGRDPESLPMVRGWSTSRELRKWPEDQLPAAVVVSPGIIGEPRKGGEYWNARWLLGIAVVVSARDQEATNSLAKLYAGAVRSALLQHPSLGGVATGIDWQTERNNEIGAEDERSLASCQVIFEVEVHEVSGAERYGLGEPPADPYDPDPTWPEVETTEITVGIKED